MEWQAAQARSNCARPAAADRGHAADLDNRTFSLTFAQPVPINDLLLLLVRSTNLSVVPDMAVAGSFIGGFVRKIPLTTTAMRFAGERALGLVSGPEPGTTPGGRSWIAAETFDAAGRTLSEVHLDGVDGYAFTAGFMAWAAQQPISGAGALGPVEAFGLERLQAGAAAAGLTRVP